MPEANSNLWEQPGWGQPTQAMLNLQKKDRMTIADKHAQKVDDSIEEALKRLSPADRDIYNHLATDEQKRVYLERQQVYGSCTHSHQCIGQAWAAYLSNYYGRELPALSATAVAHLLTIFKVLRGARVYHPDNYVDGHNYFEFANCFQRNGQ